jgi:hypothetical protein
MKAPKTAHAPSSKQQGTSKSKSVSGMQNSTLRTPRKFPNKPAKPLHTT